MTRRGGGGLGVRAVERCAHRSPYVRGPHLGSEPGGDTKPEVAETRQVNFAVRRLRRRTGRAGVAATPFGVAGVAEVLEVGERLRLRHRPPGLRVEELVGELDHVDLARLGRDLLRRRASRST